MRHDACDLLRRLGAGQRLLRHAELVGGVADILTGAYRDLGIAFDAAIVELGAALHDAGKILHPDELTGPGRRHEQAGQTLLLAHGIPPEVAKCCVSHAAWQDPGVSFEERTVALADRLWRGCRDADLELAVIDEAALRLGVGRWGLFGRLDLVFEAIAADGNERLRISLT